MQPRLTPLVMGVVNVTPDSFFAAARTETIEDAVIRGRALVAEGADLIDVGGESTRPGATPVSEAEELARVIPVIEQLSVATTVSVDTTKEAVARAAVAAGARLINDVGGTLAPVAAELGVGWVAMHANGDPATMQLDPHYDDVVGEVSTWLEEAARSARAVGVEVLWLDPGIGFGKRFEDNWALLRHADELAALAERLDAGLLIGTSRKRFLGEVGGEGLEADERLEGSLATAVAAMEAGAGMLRVHDVVATVQAVRVFAGEMAVAS